MHMYAHMSVECIWVCLCVEMHTLVYMGMSVCELAYVYMGLSVFRYAHVNVYGYVCVCV